MRNLGLKVDDKTLKRVARIAVKKFWDNVAAGLAEPLEAEVLAEEAKEEGAAPPSATRPVVIQQSKIVRSKDRVDAETKQLRSKGYGFVEFASHADALACLRWMNNNPLAFGYYNGPPKSPEELAKLNVVQKKPIVEFAIDNMLVVKKRDEIQKMKLRCKKAAAAEAAAGGVGTGAGKEKRDRKRKRGSKGEEAEAKEVEAKAAPASKKGKGMPASAPAASVAGIKAAKQAAPAKRDTPKGKQEKRAPGKGPAATAAVGGKTGANKKAPAAPASAPAAPASAQKRARPAAPAVPKTAEEKATKKLKMKARESAKEDKFNAMVEGYKQKLFAAPSEKKRASEITRWFE